MDKFTVIIPTLDHCETLAHTLESCIVQQDDHFKILVSDNLSTDATQDVIEAYRRRDSRIESIQPPSRLSMASHYEFALGHVKEGFVMLLGADDGLMPGCMSRARTCLKEHPDTMALHGSINALFYYPDFYREENAGRLCLRLAPRNEIRQARAELESVARGEGGAYQLPQPYHVAWVHVKVLDQLVAKTGRRIHSPTPDIYLAVAVASQLQNYVHHCPPFGIYGVSVKSTGGSMVHAQGSRKIENDFLHTSDLSFHPKIGYSRSVDMQTGECLLQAIDLGLLPPDFPIQWDRLIARGYMQFCNEPWDEAQRQDNIARLREQARNVGCASMMELADQFADWRDWKANLPFDIDYTERPWELVADTRPLGIRGIHEAARIAEELFLAAEEGSAVTSVRDANHAALRSWGLLQLGLQGAGLRAEQVRLLNENNKVNAEKRKAKAKLSSLREINQKLKTKARGSKEKKSILQRWFGGQD